MSTIQLKQYGISLSTRSLVAKIMIEGEDEYILDFSSIKIITPSFSHQLILEAFNKNIKISIENANEEIISQLKRAISLVKREKIKEKK